ncbi:hypothetical protein B9S53_12085 [Arthrospira sp. O9.13F]|nr:hypothetical protein B9S53_12085 [Arthrospira sp. O9.13F]
MSELPKGWVALPLNVLGMPSTPNVDPSKFPNEIFELYSVPAYANKEPDIVPGSSIHSVKQLVQPGDVLLCKIVPHLNRVWIVQERGQYRQIASGEWIVVRSEIVDSDYLRYELTEPAFRSAFMQTVSGVGGSLMRARTKAVAEIQLATAPLNEQRRIVAKLDRLFARSRCAREELGRVSGLVQRYKKAVLAAAFRGDLTADWREENPTISMNNKLHDLDQARQKIWQENQILRGKDPRKIKYKKAVEIDLEGRTKGIEKLFELPETWTWISLGQIVWDVSDGPHFSPKYVDSNNGIPFISARNVKYSGIDFADAKYISLEDYQTFIQRAKPEVGDVLLTKGGTTGISTVVETDREFGIWVHIALLKIVHRFVIPEYLRDALSSSYAYQQSQAQTHGVGNQDLGLTRMVYIALTLPPIDEQQEIVRRVEKLFKVIDIIEQEHQKASKLLDRLEKATLSKAFRGELVPQDPNDEPAAVLLERIQAQRQTQPKRKAKSTRKPKAN